MGNTVGSCENKHWQKKWLPIKRNLVLTEEQRSVLVGSLLGDGTLRRGIHAIHANFKIEHGLRQRDYVLWKYKIFQPWVFTEPKVSYRYKTNGESYAKSWWFRTVRHPAITEFWRRYYPHERKAVPSDVVRDLTPLALAVWIMDDGCYARSRIDISTYAFTFKEIKRLCEALQKKFSLEGKYFPDRDKGYRMYFTVPETKRIIEIALPYIHPSLRYKIGSH